MDNLSKKLCPVCGYQFEEPIFNDNGELEADFTICPSCGYEYAVTDIDKGFSFKEWRHEWIRTGMLFKHVHGKERSNWNPKAQLETIGVKLDENNNIVDEPEDPVWHINWVTKN